MALIDDFKTRFPEFNTGTVDSYFPVLESMWPSYYNVTYRENTREAVLNLLAHLLVSETEAASVGGAGASFAESSRSVDGVSVSFIVPPAAQDSASYSYWATTRYGQRFWLLSRTRYGGVAV